MADGYGRVMVENGMPQQAAPSQPEAGPRWTLEQKDAIYSRGCDILVAAGAGAGKTAVLVERVIQGLLRENGLDIERLLVVTFTEAAAAEMRERIRDALEEKLRQEPSNARLQQQLARLPLASISTIHAFCSRLLRRYFYYLGLDPGFRIMTEAEAGLLRSEILDELLAGHYQKGNREVLDFIDAYGGRNGDEEVRKLILRLYAFQMSLADPEGWQRQVLAAFHPDSPAAVRRSPLFHEAERQLLLEINQVERMLKAALDICRLPNGPARYGERLQEEKDAVEELAEMVRKQQWDKLRDWPDPFGRLPSISKKLGVDEELKEQCKKLRDAAKDKVKKLTANMLCRTEDQVAEEMGRLAPTVQLIFRLVNEFAEAYGKAKHSQGMVDFADLERLALKLLTTPGERGKFRPSPVALELQERFDEVLIDEYQDTNGVQDCILALVAGAWDEEPGAVPRFMVGDIKQSIYGFRLTDPGLFLSKYHRFSSSQEAAQRRIDLATNFRCRQEIIHGVNFIFRQLMTTDIAGIPYDEKAELKHGAEYPELVTDMVEVAAAAEEPAGAASRPRCIEIYLLDSETGEEAGEDYGEGADEDEPRDGGPQLTEDDPEELEQLEREAWLMAKRIHQMMGCDDGGDIGSGAGGGKMPALVWDKSLRTYRPVQYRDIVVLLRSVKNRANQVLEVFRQAGIPAYAQLDSGYFAAIEVKLMIALLQVLDNPQQDIPLAAILRAPWFGVTDEELAQVRLGTPKGSFYWVIKNAAQREDRLGRKLRIALASLEKWRTAARRLPLSELISLLYRETGFYDYASSMPKGEQRQANLRGLQERAREFDGFAGRGLSRFVQFLERLQAEDDLGEVRPIGEGENVVRIMSMHKSKGLEFPIVFLADLGKGFNLQDLRQDVLIHKDLGIGLNVIDPEKRYRYDSFSHQVIKARLRRDLLAEEMRILYVAMTRAREQLILVGTGKDLAKAAAGWAAGAPSSEWALPSDVLISAGCYLDWLGPALIRHQDGTALRLAAGKGEQEEPVGLIEDPSRWYIWMEGHSPCLDWMEASLQEEGMDSIPWQEIQQLKPLSPSPSDGLRQEFSQRLLWEYPKGELVNLPAKLSVTEMKRWALLESGDLQKELAAGSALPSFRSSRERRGVRRPRFILAERARVSAVERGIWTHTALQHLDLTRDLADREILEDEAQRLVKEGYLAREQLAVVALGSIAQFFQSSLGRRLLKQPDSVRREVPFTLAVSAAEVYGLWEQQLDEEKVIVQGVIDCLVKEPGGFLLIDFKTDRISKAGVEEAARSYRMQIDQYCRAVETIFRQPVKEAYLYFLQGALAVQMY
ncbi:MAG: UvrD-helicase domain-containing protein [Firmicutes bacterium]|nr:UvrD-helicase domain-containing protein [Bacillota bacterium]